MTHNNPHVFLDITHGSEVLGKIIIELFRDVVPKTAENFRQLCTGEAGSSKLSPAAGRKLTYKGSVLFRILPGTIIQGGDITHNNGSGGESIYGRTFPDENFTLKHDCYGVLSMANTGRDSNSSQFFFTIQKHFGKEASHPLDGYHVVFGKVVKGTEVLQAIEKVKVDRNGKPVFPLRIQDCGEYVESTCPSLPPLQGTTTSTTIPLASSQLLFDGKGGSGRHPQPQPRSSQSSPQKQQKLKRRRDDVDMEVNGMDLENDEGNHDGKKEEEEVQPPPGKRKKLAFDAKKEQKLLQNIESLQELNEVAKQQKIKNKNNKRGGGIGGGGGSKNSRKSSNQKGKLRLGGSQGQRKFGQR